MTETVDWEKIKQFLEPKPTPYCPHEPFPKQKAFLRTEALEALYGGRAAGGKCLRCPDRAQPWYNESMESKVLTPAGFKLIGDIEVGDRVCNPDGTVSTVIKVSDNGKKQFYKVTTIDGASVEVSADHIWAIWQSGRRKRGKEEVPTIPAGLSPEDEWNLRLMQRTSLVTTETLRDLVAIKEEHSVNGERAYYINIPLPRPLKMTLPKGRWTTLPPYTLGVLIGDGTITGNSQTSFYTADEEIESEVSKELASEKFGWVRISKSVPPPPKQGASYKLTGNSPEGLKVDDFLKRDNLLGTYSHTKFIPKRVKCGPIETRVAFIQGLFDTDGHMDERGHVEYVTVSKQLAEDTQFVLRSLGYRATISEKQPYYEYKGEKLAGKLAYRLYVQGANKEALFRLERKRSKVKPWNGQEGGDATVPGTRVVSVEATVIDNSRCITVAHPNALFVTDDFIVTHNSDALLMGALQYSEIPGYAAILFRNSYADLAMPGALMDRAKTWWGEYPEVKWSQQSMTATFPGGGRITFGYLQNPDDHLRYKGGEYQYCVSAETKVLMGDGTYKPIRSITAGEQVQTLQGSRSVTKVHHVGVKPAVEVRSPTHSATVSTTHKMLTKHGWEDATEIRDRGQESEFILHGNAAVAATLLFKHPYSGRTLQASEPTSTSECSIEDVADVEMMDLTVEELSHYIIEGGFIVANCGFDELTEIREESYRYMLSRLRRPSVHSGHPLNKVPLRARSASNPAANWVRRYFLEEGPSKGRLYIPAGYQDNPYVDHVSYADALSRLSPVHRAQLEFGEWYAEESGRFFERGDFTDHIIGPEEIPHKLWDTTIVRYWDLAATEPSDSNPDPDWSVGVKAAIIDGYFFILHIRRFRGNPDKVEKLVYETAIEDGPHVKVRMDKDPGQAGKAQVSHYSRNVLLGFDFDGMPTTKDKETRVGLWAPKVKRGEVLLVRGEWINDFVDEAVGFGSSTSLHDDQMDAVSGAFEILTGIHKKTRGKVRLIV